MGHVRPEMQRCGQPRDFFVVWREQHLKLWLSVVIGGVDTVDRDYVASNATTRLFANARKLNWHGGQVCSHLEGGSM